MAYTVPTVADFKSRFDRDFAFCSADDQTDYSKVRDADVTRALTSAQINFNEAIWATQAAFSEAMLLLAAHFLCTNLLNSSQGLRGQGEWLVNHKRASNLDSSFAIPDRIMKSPALAAISKTGYGMEYLSLITPLLVGNVVALRGRSTPD